MTQFSFDDEHTAGKDLIGAFVLWCYRTHNLFCGVT
jgi:hypothetical protein